MTDDKPWLTEPLEHLFESHGFVCFARRRTVMDTWCGYVYVPASHAFAALNYDDPLLDEIGVHGGLTYSNQEGDAWCFGFDCAHYMDLRPDSQVFWADKDIDPFADATWKSLDFVINELDNLAQQLKEKEQ